jgi:methyl-accepting chemotaxis protein
LKAKKAASGSADLVRKFDQAIREVDSEQKRLQRELSSARNLAPSSERLALTYQVASSASTRFTNLAQRAKSQTDKAQAKIEEANEAIHLAMRVAESFSDNPARRVASILMGGG